MGNKAGWNAELKKKQQAEREASMTPKQIRARARRRREGLATLTRAEKDALMGKPMEEWDLEELARCRPRDKNGNFSGPAPQWVTREMHEKALDLFKNKVRTDMRSLTVKALDALESILENEETDDKGRPVVPVGVRKDVAFFLVEHLIGKPTQPIEADISIKLQGILGASLVQTDDRGNMIPAASHRVIDSEIEDEDGDEEEEPGA